MNLHKFPASLVGTKELAEDQDDSRRVSHHWTRASSEPAREGELWSWRSRFVIAIWSDTKRHRCKVVRAMADRIDYTFRFNQCSAHNVIGAGIIRLPLDWIRFQKSAGSLFSPWKNLQRVVGFRMASRKTYSLIPYRPNPIFMTNFPWQQVALSLSLSLLTNCRPQGPVYREEDCSDRPVQKFFAVRWWIPTTWWWSHSLPSEKSWN